MLFDGITKSYYFNQPHNIKEYGSHNICTTTLTGALVFSLSKVNSTFDGCDKLKQN